MERYYEAIDLLKGMISRPSFSRDETAVADFLQAEWQKAGQKVFRKGNNLWIIAPDFDFGKPTLLLNSHIDTVKPASGWTKDPFTPEETEDDQLYGLGSNDAGASVVSLYEAFCILSEKEQPYNLIFLASCEEVIPGIGVYAVWVEVEGERYKGMLYIGDRPTLNNGKDISMEVNILDFSGDIYNDSIRVSFVQYVRGDIKFDSLEELKAQLEKDRCTVNNLL